MIALREAQKSGLLRKNQWLPNLIAGVIVGIVALPLAMAFAIASGVKPEQGIYTAIVAALAVSIFGGSRYQIAGPTGAFIVLLSGIVASYGIEGLQIATLMAGLMLVAMGFAKFGGVIKYIPAPVIVGFTAGIGVIIWVGQWEYFFGLSGAEGQYFHEKFGDLLTKLPNFHMATTGLSILTLLVIIFFPKIKRLRRIPSPLIAMIAATLVQSYFQFEDVATIGSAFGGIPQGLPTLTFPTLTLDKIFSLVGPAFTIAMLGAIESLLSAVVADGMTGSRHQSNQELVGQGLANVVAPLFGGIAATGAIARTATNVRNGGTGPLAGIFHSVFLVIVLLFLAPLAADIPLAAMAAILVVVSYNMAEIRHFSHMVKTAPRADVAILLITFFLTVFTDLVVAVNVGVMISILYFLQKMTSSIKIHLYNENELNEEMEYREVGRLPEEVLVYSIEGPFFFGAVENFERALEMTKTDPKALIIRLNHVPFVDITGLETLNEVIGKLKKRGVLVFLCEANPSVRAHLHRTGVLEEVGKGMYWKRFSSALIRCRRILDAQKKEEKKV